MKTLTADDELYDVRPEVWSETGLGFHDGCLCIGCLETRIGRRLKPNDFNWEGEYGLNYAIGSDRLMNRKGYALKSNRKGQRTYKASLLAMKSGAPAQINGEEMSFVHFWNASTKSVEIKSHPSSVVKSADWQVRKSGKTTMLVTLEALEEMKKYADKNKRKRSKVKL
jgi:hypothetical protein